MTSISLRRCSFGSFSLVTPLAWLDTTDPGGPWTLTQNDGVGALQFTVVVYRAGPVPDPGPSELLEMLLTFARPHTSGVPYDVVLATEPVRLAAASFTLPPSDFLRAWYVSDGLSCAQVTYICDQAAIGVELHQAEDIVRSIRFIGGIA